MTSLLLCSHQTVHILSFLVISIAFVEIVLYYIYRKQSRNLFLGTRPGFIAHCMSILPQTEANPISPADSKHSLKRKLENMQFMLDEDGYIVGLTSQEVNLRKSRGLSQPNSMLKFHPEPYDHESLYSREPDSAKSWGSMKSPGLSTPITPPPSGKTGLTGWSSPNMRQGSTSTLTLFESGSGESLGQELSYQQSAGRGAAINFSSTSSSGRSHIRGGPNRSLSTLEESEESLPGSPRPVT